MVFNMSHLLRTIFLLLLYVAMVFASSFYPKTLVDAFNNNLLPSSAVLTIIPGADTLLVQRDVIANTAAAAAASAAASVSSNVYAGVSSTAAITASMSARVYSAFSYANLSSTFNATWYNNSTLPASVYSSLSATATTLQSLAISSTAGAAVSTAAVAGTFFAVGLSPLGPVAGGWFASHMGAGLVSGSCMAMAQSAAMTATTYTTVATVGAGVSAATDLGLRFVSSISSSGGGGSGGGGGK